VSHANNKTRRRWLPNLQSVKIIDREGQRRHVRVCVVHRRRQDQKAPNW
jgi:ribosomal protein L28